MATPLYFTMRCKNAFLSCFFQTATPALSTFYLGSMTSEIRILKWHYHGEDQWQRKDRRTEHVSHYLQIGLKYQINWESLSKEYGVGRLAGGSPALKQNILFRDIQLESGLDQRLRGVLLHRLSVKNCQMLQKVNFGSLLPWHQRPKFQKRQN